MNRVAGVAAWLLVFTPITAAGEVRRLTIEDRVQHQRALEEVYWRHRIWPSENKTPKPPLSATLTDKDLRGRVEDGLKKSAALEELWHRPVTSDQLQAEIDRMIRHTQNGAMLAELFRALHDDPFVIAETLARPTLVDRLIREWQANDTRFQDLAFDLWWEGQRAGLRADVDAAVGPFVVRAPDATACTPGTWAPTRYGVPDPAARHTAVWTGAEMIVWGGQLGFFTPSAWARSSGGRYNPATDTWTPTSNGPGTPQGRAAHTAIWTGTEMIVWGGAQWVQSEFQHGPVLNTGGRYNPVSDSWTATSTAAGVPTARTAHTAVWTGTVMIVSGGMYDTGDGFTSTGARYDPSTDTWTATSPGLARIEHTAVWTGTVMIVWGGRDVSGPVATGARYNPVSNTWAATTNAAAPAARAAHAAVWTGTEMIVWGGGDDSGATNTGGRYDPLTNAWMPTSTASGVPPGRTMPTAVWTGSRMIVWGGDLNTGGLYDPAADSWTATSTGPNVPAPRTAATAVWTGAEMIVWGGGGSVIFAGMNTGGRYSPGTDSWVPTSTGSYVPTGGSFPGVWTGTEMIVWGGTLGGRYSPALDAWTPTSSVGAPSTRTRHTVVWTGSQVIVWGGDDASFHAINSGGRYSPSTDTWAATSLVGAPSARQDHAAVWTGGEMIVWGGMDDNETFFASGGRYDPASDTWTTTALSGAPAGRIYHTAVWTGSEMIVWGGGDYGAGMFGYDTGGRYAPFSNTWVPTSTGAGVPVPRFSHTAVWTGSGMTVWGGGNGGTSGGRYDPASNSWTATGQGVGVPSGRLRASAVWTGSEMIVWGGGETSILNDGGRYHAPSDTWVPTSMGPNLPSTRMNHTAVWTGSHMIVWGGSPDTASGALLCVAPPAGPHARYFGQADMNDACSGTGSGGGNDRWDFGEDVRFSVTISNDGGTALTGVTATVTSPTPGVIVLDGTAAYPELAAGSFAVSNPPHFSVRLPASPSCDEDVSFDVQIHSDQGTWSGGAFKHRFGPASPVTVSVLEEDFASGITGGWTVVNGGAAPTWTTANPGGRGAAAPITSPFAIVDSAIAQQSYFDDQLITPLLDVSSASSVSLEFDQFFRWDPFEPEEIGDVDVRSSLTGGTWVNVLRNEFASTPHPDHRALDLTALAAGASDVQVRFHYYFAFGDFWWMVDNVKVQQVVANCTVDTCAPGGIARPASDLDASRVSPTTIQVTWDAASCLATNYEILYGSLSSLPSYTLLGSVCGIGTSGSTSWTGVPAGNLWFLVTGVDGGGTEASWGPATAGERNGGSPSNQCGNISRNDGTSCP